MPRLTKQTTSIYSWSELHGSTAGTCAWNSHAIVVAPGGAVILVDPLGLSDTGVAEVERLGVPSLVFLTGAYHARDAEGCRKRWGCPVAIHGLAGSTTEIRVDRTVGDDVELAPGVRALHLPGVYWPEETALLVAGDPPALIVGDALSGPRSDIDLPPGHVGMFSTKHIVDPAVAKRTFEELCNLHFELLLFGHGDPVRNDPREAIRLFLGSHPLWHQS